MSEQRCRICNEVKEVCCGSGTPDDDWCLNWCKDCCTNHTAKLKLIFISEIEVEGKGLDHSVGYSLGYTISEQIKQINPIWANGRILRVETRLVPRLLK